MERVAACAIPNGVASRQAAANRMNFRNLASRSFPLLSRKKEPRPLARNCRSGPGPVETATFPHCLKFQAAISPWMPFRYPASKGSKFDVRPQRLAYRDSAGDRISAVRGQDLRSDGRGRKKPQERRRPRADDRQSIHAAAIAAHLAGVVLPLTGATALSRSRRRPVVPGEAVGRKRLRQLELGIFDAVVHRHELQDFLAVTQWN